MYSAFAVTVVNGNSLIKKLWQLAVMKDLVLYWKSQAMIQGQHSKSTNCVEGKKEMEEERDSVYFPGSCLSLPPSISIICDKNEDAAQMCFSNETKM